MNKPEYLALALEFECDVTDDNKVGEIKTALGDKLEAICGALVKERVVNEEEIAGLNAALKLAGKKAEAKAEVVSIDDKDYLLAPGKHIVGGVEVTAELLNNDADFAAECVKKGYGFLAEH